MEEIELKDIIKILLKHKKMILILFIVAILLSSIISLFIIDKIYETSTTMNMGKAINDKIVVSYSETIKGDNLFDKVVSSINTTKSASEIKESIKIDLVGSNNIKITVTSNDRAITSELANAVAQQFLLEAKEAMGLPNAKILSVAKEPTSPIKPNVAQNIAISAVLAIMLGVFVAFMIEYIKNSVRSTNDIQLNLGLPLLAIIPINDSSNNNESIINESYTTLSSNIKFAKDSKLKTILVTSSEPLEGNSTIASSLALSLFKTGSKTLLVDCNLRQGTIHNIFEVDNQQGIADVLLNGSSYKDYVKKVEDNLDILLSGSTKINPSELLASNKMQQLLKDLEKDYDYIIIDSPSILSVTDPIILGGLVDGVVLVIKYDSTSRDNVIEAKNRLEKVNANIIGSVLTEAKLSKSESYYPYFDHYSNTNEAEQIS